MKRSIIRSLVAVLMVTSVALIALAGPASAKGRPVTITLTCTSDASWLNVSIQFRAGDLTLGTDVGDPVPMNCGPASESGQMTNTIVVKRLPEKPDGFIAFYTYGPTTGSPEGGADFVLGGRDTTQPVVDSVGVLIGTVTVD